MAQVLDAGSFQIENNPTPGFTQPHLNNLQGSVSGGPAFGSVPVTITAVNSVTGARFEIGTITVGGLSNQGSGSFNTGKLNLNIPLGNYRFEISSPGFTSDTTDSAANICFCAGTLIRTSSGDVAVEDLAIGDLVRTADGRDVPVIFVGRQSVHTYFAAESNMPIRIRAGALAEKIPARDLFVSPNHAIAVDGTLCNAQALVNGTTIAPVAAPADVFTYYSIELPAHEVILAEGATVESFCDNVPRARFCNAAEFDALYPDGRDVGELTLPRAASARQVPAAIRTRIRDRAALLLGAVNAAA